ncbi:hypothetical protein L3Y34_019619 [Caenorhabditis briggsae]|uniref:Uncharacterized protein n=1 Tax=Caenorhabditis briggsae TaxID=6238 RepID=A0AAE9DN79_CAEBR|nr:hypothetical protein L3Y34_019619 [Caenorhabditis briggsae]
MGFMEEAETTIQMPNNKKKNIEYVDWEQLDENLYMAQVDERQFQSRRRENYRRRLQALRGEGTLVDPIFIVLSDTEDEEVIVLDSDAEEVDPPESDEEFIVFD